MFGLTLVLKKNNKATLKIEDGCHISSYTHKNAF